MKITIDKHPDQDPIVIIDTTPCKSIYAIREALQLALDLDGYDKETIKNVFNLQEDIKTEPQAEPAQEQGHFTNDEGGYAKAMTWLDTIGLLDEINDKCSTMADVIKKANELWEQDHPKQ